MRDPGAGRRRAEGDVFRMGHCIDRSDIDGNEVIIVGIEVVLLRRGREATPTGGSGWRARWSSS